MSIQTESKAEFLHANCSRFLHGSCTTRACLLRGGWKPGESKDKATCAPFEIWNDLALAERLLKAVRQCHYTELDSDIDAFLARDKDRP